MPGLSKFLMGLYFSCCGGLNNAAQMHGAFTAQERLLDLFCQRNKRMCF